MLPKQELYKFAGKIDDYLESQQYPTEIADILLRLEKDFVPTVQLLKTTKLGQKLARLKKAPNAQIVTLATRMVDRWKQIVNEQKSQTDLDSKVRQTVTARNLLALQNGGTDSPLIPSSRESSIPPPTTPQLPASSIHVNQEVKMERERSFDLDECTVMSTGIDLRNTAIKQLYNSLAFDSLHPADDILKVSTGVEEILYEKLGKRATDSGVQYKTRLRFLITRLRSKTNPALRASLVCGALTVDRFMTMSDSDMKSAEEKAAAEELAERNFSEAQGAAPLEHPTDMFKCGKCKMRKTTYYQLQTRSADEPMTTFVKCLECGNRWKFC